MCQNPGMSLKTGQLFGRNPEEVFSCTKCIVLRANISAKRLLLESNIEMLKKDALSIQT